MKSIKHSLLLISVVLLMSGSIFAQGTSCSCSNQTASCSTSANCPNGNAVCVCSDFGCTSYCLPVVINEFTGEFPDTATLLLKLKSASNKEIADVLTKSFGRKITFSPFAKNFRFDYSAQTENHWEILQYLSQNGELKINGGEYSLWKKIREIVTAGKLNFCTGNAVVGILVNELSFLTGKKYRIVSGDSKARVNTDIKGLTVDGIVEALEKHNQLLIEQR